MSQSNPAAWRARHFPGIADVQWQDWRWQLRHRLRSGPELAALLGMASAPEPTAAVMPVTCTPYYAGVAAGCAALGRTIVPDPEEGRAGPGDRTDPLGEEDHMPAPGIVHRYPDRALFLVGSACAVACRYCTRGRQSARPGLWGPRQWQAGLDYLAATPAIRDVLISGGEPLLFSDGRLDGLLTRLRAIPHVQMLRIGTKVPMALPQRVTPELAAMLRRHHPLYLSLHVIHPGELTPEAAMACNRLADAGIPLGSQTVLLRGVNDDPAIIRDLMQRLLGLRVRPYYLLQCDPVLGAGRFRTPIEVGIEIIRHLRGHTSGYAVPHFIVDLPGGGGKIALEPDYVTSRDADGITATNYQGIPGWRYP